MSNEIKIFDTTLRDGEQSPGCSMNLSEKIEMALQLERLNVDIVEAGFAIASPDDFLSVQTVAKTLKNTTVASLARCVKEDIDRAYEAVKVGQNPRIHVFLATSDIHLEHKLKMTRAQVIERISAMVSYAKSLCSDIEFSAEDASRSDKDFLLETVNAAILAGAGTINLPDTVGYAYPDEMFEMISHIKKNIIKPAIISCHCHNDLGLGVANSLAAIRAGATQVECTVNGIGERAGNAALEEIVMALHTKKDLFNVNCNIDTKQIYRSSKLLSTITGVSISPTKPIVGANAFAHEAGIHQHGVLKNRLTYEIMSPEVIGIPENKMVLGKHSGKHAFEDRIKTLGYTISKEELVKAFERFKQLADKKKTVSDKDIEALITDSKIEINQNISFVNYVINTGTTITATATVKLDIGGSKSEKVATGDGPIDACFKAIDKIVKIKCELDNYSINSITEGEDALGEVVVKIKFRDEIITGRGLSTDIIEASIKAYLNALNKIS